MHNVLILNVDRTGFRTIRLAWMVLVPAGHDLERTKAMGKLLMWLLGVPIAVAILIAALGEAPIKGSTAVMESGPGGHAATIVIRRSSK